MASDPDAIRYIFQTVLKVFCSGFETAFNRTEKMQESAHGVLSGGLDNCDIENRGRG